jgi:4-amino-4-deoxy-L-arabinose transferase-like glycosyltransferase
MKKRLHRRIRFSTICLIFIIIGAAFLRLYHLGSNPPSLYWEENALGYDAYSILKTGKDFHGNLYPLLAFPSFGDYKPSGYFYAIVPFIQLVGLNAWAVRLPSALAGILSVILLYFIAKELFDERVAVVSAALLAIQPWSLQFSRAGFEVNLACMLILAGTHCLLTARKKIWMLPVAVLFFGLSMYTYHAARLFAPLVGAGGGLMLLWWWFRREQKKPKQKIVSLVLACILACAFVLPFIINVKSSTVSSRFSETSIFTDLQPILDSNAAIAAHGNALWAKLVYHRATFFARIAFNGWVSHFSPVFLFMRGDGNYRHGTITFGLLYRIEVLFILMTLIALFVKREWKLLLIMIWIALAAVAPSLVKPTPHALRFLFASPAFAILSAYGIVFAVHHVRKYKVFASSAIGVALLYSAVLYVNWYHAIYPVRSSKDWQYGYVQMYQSIANEKKNGEQVYITTDEGRPSMYYLFQSGYDPATIQRKGPSLPKDQLELIGIDDYHFVTAVPSVSGLFATPENKVDPKAKVLETVRRLDGSVVWIIWRR